MASAEEGRFRGVPRTKEKWLKVFVCFFWQRVLSTVQYLSRLDDFSKFRVNVIFLDIADCMT